MWIRETLNALVACVVTFVICAVAYPAMTWGMGQLIFPRQAEGSLVYDRGRAVVGSELIAQPFASDGYFRPRPSAAGPNGYAADAASGSNLGTKNPALRQRIALDAARQIQLNTGDVALKALLDDLDARQAELKAKNEIAEKTKSDTEDIAKLEERVAALQAEILKSSAKLAEEKKDRLVPADLVTTSGGGLDPHISPEAARYQAARVASARKLPEARVLELIDQHTNHSGAIIGAPPRVNVLLLNRALDEEKPAPTPDPAPSAEATPPTVEAGGAPDVPDRAAEIAAIRSQIGELSIQLAWIRERVGAAEGVDTAAALKEIDARVSALAEARGRVAPLADQVGRIDERVREAGDALQHLRSDLAEARDVLRTLQEKAAPRPAPSGAEGRPVRR